MPTKANISLAVSEVVFAADSHRYHLGERRLSGLTSAIREVVGLGYRGGIVPAYILDRAAEYGSSVHRAIEVYDTLGFTTKALPKSSRFAETDGDVWNVERELANYIRHRDGYTPLANEYLVTDGERYASAIDNVWLDAEGCIVLADTKTNNLASYPGGRAAWLKYLSWQLSAYAVLFERMNPGLQVKRLVCNWLRHDDHELIDIERLPTEDVERLLAVTWHEDSDGNIVFDADSMAANGFAPSAEVAIVKADNTQLVPAEVVRAIADLERQAAAIKAESETLRAKLHDAMSAAGVTKWTTDYFTATFVAESEVRSLDTKRLQAEHAELCEQYMRTSKRRSFIKITLKPQ